MKLRWLDSRAEYLRNLENLVAGPSETNLVMSYEERIAAEGIEPAELRRLVSVRNSLIDDFAELRGKYHEFLRIRSGLSAALTGSFCILGPGTPLPADFLPAAAPKNFPVRLFPRVGREPVPGELVPLEPIPLEPIPSEPIPSDAETSAILANTILSGRAVVFPAGHYILLWSLLIALLILFLIRRLGPILTLIAGVFMTILTAAVFSWGFIFTQYWFDPLIPAGSAAAGVLASFFCSLYMKHRNQAVIRRIYGGVVGPFYLERLVRAGRPQAGETLRARAAIVAIRRDARTSESGKDLLDIAGETRTFWETAARCFKKAGGAVVGTDEDLTLIAFGSPLERIAMRRIKTETPYDDDGQAPGVHSPEAKAAGFILDLLKETPEAADWRFGIDTGDCAFGYSELSGYAAFGRPVARARILSGIASRCHARILVTAQVSEGIDGFLTRKLDTTAGKEKETFYEILTS
jgi:class 3 adenylate cyclase